MSSRNTECCADHSREITIVLSWRWQGSFYPRGTGSIKLREMAIIGIGTCERSDLLFNAQISSWTHTNSVFAILYNDPHISNLEMERGSSSQTPQTFSNFVPPIFAPPPINPS